MADSERQRMVARRLLGGGAWAIGGRLFSAAIAFLIGIALARLLAPAAFGSYALTMSVVTLMAVAGGLGADQAVVRLVSSARGSGQSGVPYVRHGMLLAACGGLVAAVLIWAGAGALFVRVFDAPLLAQHAVLLALLCFALVIQRQLAETYRAHHDIREAEIFSGLGRNGILSGSLLLAALLSAQALGVMDYRAAVVCTVLSVALTALAAAFFLRHRITPMDAVDRSSKPRMLAIALPLGAAILMLTLRGHVDIWLVAATTDAEQTALYNASLRLAVLVQMPVMIVKAVVPPMIAELHTMRDTNLMESLVRSVATAASIPAAVFVAILVLAGGSLMGALYGPFYSDGGTILSLLAVAQFAVVLSGPAIVGLAMTGGERVLLKITTVAVITAAAAGYFAGMRYGAEGVAAVSALVLIAQSIAIAWWFRLRLGIWPVATLSPRRLAIFTRHFRPGREDA